MSVPPSVLLPALSSEIRSLGRSQQEGRRLDSGVDRGPGRAAEDPSLHLPPVMCFSGWCPRVGTGLLLRVVVPPVVRGAGCGAVVRVVGRRPDGVPEARGQAAVTWSAASQDRDRWGGPWVDRWSLAAWGSYIGEMQRGLPLGCQAPGLWENPGGLFPGEGGWWVPVQMGMGAWRLWS